MGSKRLKAVVVRGNLPVPLHDGTRAKAIRMKYLKRKDVEAYDLFHDTGTVAAIADLLPNGRCPVKNWGGVGIVDFPVGEEEYEEDRVMSYQKRRYACWHCPIGWLSYEWPFVPDSLEAVTGWEWSLETLRRTGDRIGTMRHLFNLREGINPLEYPIQGRIVGDPPQTTGPLEGRTLDYETMIREYLEYSDWDPVTTVPSRTKLEELGLGDLAPIFHPI